MSTAITTDDVGALLGQRYRLADHYEVSREKIREFARAVKNRHAAHFLEDAAVDLGHDGLVAPLTLTAILGSAAQRFVFTEFLTDYDLSQVLHTEQRIVSHRPVIAGDRLNSEICLESFRRRHGQDSFVLRTDITDHNDELVQASWTHAVARTGGAVDTEILDAVERIMMDRDPLDDYVDKVHAERSWRPQPLPARPPNLHPKLTVAEVTVGDELPTWTTTLRRGDLVNYAGVSGDPNPIHWSDDVAELIGLGNVVAHGMLTMGLGAGLLTHWTGDPSAIRDYSVRFSSPVFVDAREPATIDYTGKVKSIDTRHRTAAIAITAISARKRIFGRATAVVSLG